MTDDTGQGAKVPVTKRALIQRINRALAKRDGCVHGQEWPHRWEGPGGRTCSPATMIKAARGSRARLELGDYFMLDTATGGACGSVDPVQLGRELHVMQAWEELVDDEKR